MDDATAVRGAGRRRLTPACNYPCSFPILADWPWPPRTTGSRKRAGTSLFPGPPWLEMGVLAGLALEGAPAWQGNLVPQQSAPRSAGLVLSRQVAAVVRSRGIVVVMRAGGFPLRLRTGPERHGIELTRNPGNEARVHRGGCTGGTLRCRPASTEGVPSGADDGGTPPAAAGVLAAAPKPSEQGAEQVRQFRDVEHLEQEVHSTSMTGPTTDQRHKCLRDGRSRRSRPGCSCPSATGHRRRRSREPSAA